MGKELAGNISNYKEIILEEKIVKNPNQLVKESQPLTMVKTFTCYLKEKFFKSPWLQ